MKDLDAFSVFEMSQANRGKEMRVFDWDKAAKLIGERKPLKASAGLGGDWKRTGGLIYAEGEPVPQDKSCTYLASTWAVPELDMDGDIVPCFVMESKTEWHSDTYWPESALAILNGGGK